MFIVRTVFLLSCYMLITAQERITSFISNISVLSDATLLISEKIEVICENNQIIHGIVREFPTQYHNQTGLNHTVGFDLISVKHNNNSAQYLVKTVANGKKIYIGDKDIVITKGKHSYEIIYQTNRQLGFFQDFDELYWNILGSGWRLPIDKVTATIQLPKNIPTNSIKIKIYTGFAGSQGKNYHYSITDDGIVHCSSLSPLHPHEAFTIAIAFAKGFVTPPTLLQKAMWWAKDNLLIIIMILMFILMICCKIFVYQKNKPGTIIPLFYPPKNMPPSTIGSLTFMQFTPKLLSADIVNLAVQGLLTIKYVPKKQYQLTISKQGLLLVQQKNQNNYDATLLSELFTKKKNLFIKNEYNSTIENAAEFCKTNVNKLLSTSIKSYPVISFLGMGFIGIMSIFIASSNDPSGLILVFVLYTFGCFGLLVRLLKFYTPSGRKIQDEIDGFKLYLTTTELDRINTIGTPPIKTPELYEKYLPYAIALGVEKKWTAQFASLFNEMKNQNNTYIATWYSGDSNSSFFGSNLASMSDSIASASTPPGSSSGGDGGGDSGGGGGGGGGGGW